MSKKNKNEDINIDTSNPLYLIEIGKDIDKPPRSSDDAMTRIRDNSK